MPESFFRGRRVAVTGAAGTIGVELVRQLLKYPLAELRALDTNETELFFLGERFKDDGRLQIFLCDVRISDRLNRLFKGIDIVLHAAALKHVPLCERSPFEAVHTNVVGVENVIQAALVNRVERVLMTSSDKAVNPTNVMGTSKLMAERLMTAANALGDSQNDAIFASTRFGNVAGSHGSVIPVFCRQIAGGGPVTITDRAMTRFVMSLREAITMLLQTIRIACGGEVFVMKMPVIRTEDLAEVMVDLLAPLHGYRPKDIDIREVGPRPGEKLEEELLTEEEVRRTLELEDVFAILPAFRNIYGNVAYEYTFCEAKPAVRRYNSASEPPMSKSQIVEFLEQPLVLADDLRAQLPHGSVRHSRRLSNAS